jgi:hypothetical protein
LLSPWRPSRAFGRGFPPGCTCMHMIRLSYLMHMHMHMHMQRGRKRRRGEEEAHAHAHAHAHVMLSGHSLVTVSSNKAVRSSSNKEIMPHNRMLFCFSFARSLSFFASTDVGSRAAHFVLTFSFTGTERQRTPPPPGQCTPHRSSRRKRSRTWSRRCHSPGGWRGT